MGITRGVVISAGAGRVGPPPSHVMETEVDGDVSLYDARREFVLVLNRTASDIWLLCDGERTMNEIAETLATAYRTEPDAIRSDVESTVNQFLTEGFLQQW